MRALFRWLFCRRPVTYRCAPPLANPHLLALHIGSAAGRSALK